MNLNSKQINKRYISARAKAAAKLVSGAITLFSLLFLYTADYFVTSFLPFRIPAYNFASAMLLFFSIWFIVSGIIDFSVVNHAKTIEEELKDGPKSIDVVKNKFSKTTNSFINMVNNIKTKKLYESVAILEDCIVFERNENLRPLMLMAENGMRFTERKTRWTTNKIVLLIAALVCPLHFSAVNNFYFMFELKQSLTLAAAFIFIVILFCGKKHTVCTYKKVKPEDVKVKEETKKTEEEVVYSSPAEELIAMANTHIRELGLLEEMIGNTNLKDKIREIILATRQLVEFLRRNPARQSQVKQIINYALPTTIKLLNQYNYLDGQPVKGENITKSMNKIVEMSSVVADTLKRELDSLYAENAVDIESDIDVMTNLLKQEESGFNID